METIDEMTETVELQELRHDGSLMTHPEVEVEADISRPTSRRFLDSDCCRYMCKVVLPFNLIATVIIFLLCIHTAKEPLKFATYEDVCQSEEFYEMIEKSKGCWLTPRENALYEAFFFCKANALELNCAVLDSAVLQISKGEQPDWAGLCSSENFTSISNLHCGVNKQSEKNVHACLYYTDDQTNGFKKPKNIMKYRRLRTQLGYSPPSDFNATSLRRDQDD